MATIVTRSGKGSPLVNSELDANFVNLNNDIAIIKSLALYSDGSPEAIAAATIAMEESITAMQDVLNASIIAGDDATASAAQDALDAAVNALDISISALESSVNTKASQVEVDALTDVVYGTNLPKVDATVYSNFATNEHYLYEAPTGRVAQGLADIWTVARGSSSTYTDPTGLPRTADVNIPRITYDDLTGECVGLMVEEGETNILPYCNVLGILPIHPAVTANMGGYMTHDGIAYNKFIKGAVAYDDDASTSPDATWQFHFYDDGQNTGSGAIIRGEVRGDTVHGVTLSYSYDTQTFSWSGGAVVNELITDLGNGFYHIKFSIDSAVSNVTVFRTAIYGSSTWLGAMQLVEGLIATSIIPDATIFVSRGSSKWVWDSTITLVEVLPNVEALTYNPANPRAEPVPLYEGEATNLILQSDDLAASPWGGAATYIGSEVVNGVALHEYDDTSATGNNGRSQSLTINAGVDVTVTIRVKKGTSTSSSFSVQGAAFTVAFACIIDWETNTATFTTGSKGTLGYIANGMYEASVSVPAQYVNGGSGVLYIWPATWVIGGGTIGSCKFGAVDVVEQSYKSSHIPTTTSQVTRAADVTTGVQATRAADDVTRTLGNEFNHKEWSIYIESQFITETEPVGRLETLFAIGSDSANAISIIKDQSRQYLTVRTTVANTTTHNHNINAAVVSNNQFKLCAVYKDGYLSIYLDGVEVVTGLLVNSNNNEVTQELYSLGSRFGAGPCISQLIPEYAYCPKAITAAEAIAVTTQGWSKNV